MHHSESQTGEYLAIWGVRSGVSKMSILSIRSDVAQVADLPLPGVASWCAMDSNKVVKDVVILSAHLHREALNLLVEATGLPLRGLGSGCAHLGISSTMKNKLRNIDTVVGWVEKLSLPLIEQFLRELGAELAAAAHIDKHGLDKNKGVLKYPDARTLLDNNFQKVACTLPDDNFQKDGGTLPENCIHEDACSLSGNNLQMDAHTPPDNKLQKAACAPSDNYTQEDTCLLSDKNFQMDALTLLDYNLQKDAYTLPDNYIQEDARSFSDNNFQKDAFTLPDEKFQKDAYTLPDKYSQEDAYSLSDNNFQMDAHTLPDNKFQKDACTLLDDHILEDACSLMDNNFHADACTLPGNNFQRDKQEDTHDETSVELASRPEYAHAGVLTHAQQPCGDSVRGVAAGG